MKSFAGETEKTVSMEDIILRDSEGDFLGEDRFYLYDFGSELRYDGVLGNDVLSAFVIKLDFPRFAGLAGHEEIQDSNLIGYLKIPISFEDGHILLKTSLNGKKANLLLDTGAGISYLNTELSSTSLLKFARNIHILDLSGKKRDISSYEMEKLCVEEKICQKNIELLSGEFLKNFARPGRPAIEGVLGINWMERFILILDYKKSLLYLKKKV